MKKTFLRFVVFLSTTLLVFVNNSSEQEKKRKLIVPYVRTAEAVVETMLNMAKVTDKDTLYDLGCGDGRIVITAAEKMGAYGVGVDLNPKRIQESKKNAERAHVTDKVRFIEQDLFETDFSQATVLTLYLLQHVNLKLRPRILRELKPGSRVVSHDYHMGDWLPDETNYVYNEFDMPAVFFWIVPANVSGIWDFNLETYEGQKQCSLHLDQQFQKVNGSVQIDDQHIPVSDAVLIGDQLQFTLQKVPFSDPVPLSFQAKATNNRLEGTIEHKKSDKSIVNKWKARRDPATILPVDQSGPNSEFENE